MNNVKLLRSWNDGTVTEVRLGYDVKLSSISVNAEEGDGFNYIINKIDTERLEVTLRLNRLGGPVFVVLSRNDLTKDYAFFAQL